MLGHGAGIGYTGPGPRMGPTDNFSLVTGPTSGSSPEYAGKLTGDCAGSVTVKRNGWKRCSTNNLELHRYGVRTSVCGSHLFWRSAIGGCVLCQSSDADVIVSANRPVD